MELREHRQLSPGCHTVGSNVEDAQAAQPIQAAWQRLRGEGEGAVVRGEK